MKKNLLFTLTLCIILFTSNAQSLSLRDFESLSLPSFGIGNAFSICDLHGQPFALVTSTVICDVALLSTSQQSNIFTPENIVYINKHEDPIWIISPPHTNQHALGDPDCVGRILLQVQVPSW